MSSRSITTTITMAIFALALSAEAHSQEFGAMEQSLHIGTNDVEAEMMSIAPLGLGDVKVSTWRSDNNSTSHQIRFPHGFDDIPRIVSVYFSPNKGGGTVYPVAWSWLTNHSGNPVSMSMDSKFVYLEIWNGAPLHGVWKADGGWTYYKEGYWRVVAIK